MPEIVYKILEYKHRPWWRRKYDVRLSARGFITPDTAWIASFWTVNGARRFVEKTSNKHDFKTVEAAILQHDES